MNDYVSMNAPIVELLTKEDLALALHFLNPTLSGLETKALYKRGECNRSGLLVHGCFYSIRFYQIGQLAVASTISGVGSHTCKLRDTPAERFSR